MSGRSSFLILVMLLAASAVLDSGLLFSPAAAQTDIDPGRPDVPLPDPDPGEPPPFPPPGPDPGDESDDENETEDEPDPRDGKPGEWEEQVATDARGDVLVHWPGTTDLLYLTIGELYTFSLQESYMLVRIGYNVTTAESSDLGDPDGLPPGVPVLPEQIPDDPLITLNLTFNVSHERPVTISFYTDDYGLGWYTTGGLLVTDRTVDDHREVLYLAPLRRFGLVEGDMLSDWNITSYRGTRLVDTMQGFEPLNDPLPRYVPAHALFQDPDDLPLPVNLPQPPPPPFPPPPSPVPLPSTDPKDHVDNDPYPYPPQTGPQGIPYGIGSREDWIRWLTEGMNEVPPIDAEELTETPLDGSAAYNVTHRVTDGKSRFIVRHEKEITAADLNHIAFANFSVENLFDATDQVVMMFVIRPPQDGWLMRYGLDMPTGAKMLPAGERINMSALAIPRNLFAKPVVTVNFLFISNWGGLEVVPVRFVSLLEMQRPAVDLGDGLPDRLVVDMINRDDPFRVNEPRNIMIQVKDGTGRYVTGFTQVRAYINPAGAPSIGPFQLKEKPWMDGVYEIPYTFNRPGAWEVVVFFYDYQATGSGDFPHLDFIVRVEYPGQAPPLVPVPIALGSVALVFGAISLRERLAKAR